MTGYVPAWAAFLIGFLVFFCVGIPLGVYVGWGLGEEHANKENDEWEQAELRAAMEARRHARRAEPMWQYMADHSALAGVVELPPAVWVPPEVAHEAWTAHVEQAQAVANGPQTELMPVAADPRTDTAWTRDMAADMDRWLAALLNAHPHTEDL